MRRFLLSISRWALAFLVQLHDDAAQLQPAVEAREPQLTLPAQPAGGTPLTQEPAVVGAAVPEPAAPRPGERVFGTQQEQLAARSQDPRQLAQPRRRVGQ